MSPSTTDWIADHRDALVEFVCELIATPSPNLPGDETAVARVILDQMARLGLEGAEVVARQENRPNILYRLTGQSERTLMLAGHSDTKPPGDLSQWQGDPYQPVIRDGKLYGLGATDMKAAVGAMVFAVAAIKATCPALAGDLLLVINADEERSMAYGSDYLVEDYGLQADIALIGEPSAITGEEFEYLHIASRGMTCFTIRAYGTQMHSSLTDYYPSVNAGVELADILSRMKRELALTFEPHPLCAKPTVNLGVKLDGGVGYGVCPGVAEFQADIRTLPGMTREQIERDIETFLDRLRAETPGLKVELEFETPPLDWRPATEVPPDHPFIQSLLGACDTVLGRWPELNIFPGGTDAMNYHAKGNIPTLPSFGPGWLSMAHCPNECVGVDSIVRAAEIYASAAADYLS